MAAVGQQEPTPTSARPGKAGRCNYDQWDKVTRTLVNEAEQEEEQEIEESKKALGLDGKYADSQAHAEEREKAKDVLKAKKVLEKYQKRESAVRTELKGLLGPPPSKNGDGEEEESKATESKTVRVTRDMIDAGKRVVVIADTSGASQSDTLVLTSDLSLLESKMKANTTTKPKQYAEDAENDVDESKEKGVERKIYGLIKCFVTNVHNCTILIKCKVISGSLEINHCSNVVVKIERDATVATIQADLCENISIIFNDAPSGKNGATYAGGIPMDTSTDSKNRIYWGQDKEDRIFHAGVKNMRVQINRDGFMETERICDYTFDGAKAIGNATEEEFQFVTSCIDEELVTEAVVREGSTTGQNARPLTKREIEEEKVKREKAGNMATQMAENMFKFKEVGKDGAKKVSKTEKPKPEEVPVVEDAEEEIEEIYAGMSKEDIDAVVKECEQNKARGNEAFGTGEYAQAVLLYTLALDKADELPDDKDKTKLFARDVTLSNRAACFLKLGQHEKAEADAKLAHEYNNQNVKAFFRHGLALHAMKDYKAAISILAQAYKLEPKNKSIKEALRFAEVRLNQEMRKRME
ncbi:unnamed protein product [Pseudo-nitzschia multistriata]|uniref:Uncharacterized protein n=1 Tax=Pseudo-nitzschia multistriata TaxID=183589 RepID=A0A448ZSL0_9STRA|nr:unnamed protein product [Pseudo-nitzschia multistriata]